jgi:tripartite motif-containing protein 71
MRNLRLLAHITAALLISVILVACGSGAAMVPTAAPAATIAPEPIAVPTVASAPTTAATAASQSEASPVEFVRALVVPEQPIKHPAGVAVDAQGNVYVSDPMNDRIVKFDRTGKVVTTWGSRGTGDGQFMFVRPDRPEQFTGPLALDNQGHVYVSDTRNNRVQKFDATGKYLAKWDDPADAITMDSISIDSQGNLYIDTEATGIQKLDPNLKSLGTWDRATASDGSMNPGSLKAIDRQGNFYAADFGKPSIQKFDRNRTLLTTWGSEGSGDGQFTHPTGIVFDSHDNIYIVDVAGGRIQQFDAQSKYLGQWRDPGNGDGPFQSPFGLAIDAEDQIYVTDVDGGHVYVFRPRRP